MSTPAKAPKPAIEADSEQPLFPIREVARQTGINPVTLRAWERRYGLIKPLRTAKGHRLYTLDHIEQIRHVLDWLARGVAVSQVKQLLSQATQAHTTDDSPWRAQHDAWLAWIEQLAEAKLDEGFKQAMALYPPKTLCQHLLLPLLATLQLHWTHTDGARIEQVFFLTWLRTQLASRIAHNNRLHNSAPLLVASLSEQVMEPELWLCAWLASYSECPVRVFEQPIPVADLQLAITRLQPRAVLLHGSQRLALDHLHSYLALADSACLFLLSGPAAAIHQDTVADCKHVSCASDPLQTYHQLVNLKLLQSP